jgi:hypothetical protein
MFQVNVLRHAKRISHVELFAASSCCIT